MTALKTIVIAALIGYGGLLAFMYVAQRSLMYFPERLRTAPADAGLPQAQEITLTTADGEKLIAWYVAPKADKPLVVYFHGNGGSLRYRAERFAELIADGTGLLAVSYRGYGGSTGSPSEQGFLADALAAYEFAVKQTPKERVALWGESIGAAVAIALAVERPVGKLILESPFTSAADIGASAYPFVPVRLFIKDGFYSDRIVGKVAAPVLIMHGENDSIVPIRYGERLYSLIRAPKKFVRLRGDHNDLDSFGAMQAAREFLAGK